MQRRAFLDQSARHPAGHTLTACPFASDTLAIRGHERGTVVPDPPRRVQAAMRRPRRREPIILIDGGGR
jgi:hypothetical protein